MAGLLRDSVYKAIRRAILTCEFSPGQELREKVLAEKYRVSRSPIRDSLLRLEQEKLVTVLPRQGYRVNPLSVQDAADLFDLRVLIEPACAAGAALASDAAVATLDSFRNFRCEESQIAMFFDYNSAFHGAVADVAGNKRIAAVEYGLVESFDRLVRANSHLFLGPEMRRAVQEHDALIDAIQAHDVEAARRRAYNHIDSGQTFIIASMRTAGP